MRQLPLPLKVNPELGFKEYHQGPNQETVSHLIASASGDGESLIYVWGPSQVGKSHLLNAFCKAATPERSVALVNLNETTFKDPNAFEGLETFDAVCLDNLHTIAGDSLIEQAVFVLFNRLRDSGRSLIVSANNAPDAIGLGLHDLQSRMGWGLTLRLEPLSDVSLETALCLKAKAQGITLEPEVSRYLTLRSHRSLGELLNLLDLIDALSLEKKRRITIPLVRELLSEVRR